ncbi:S8 family serine peptidase [Brevundimonas sp. FT23028]|uniref:S8 family serine peptidase n=1 Tax=Brevundimonas sp. FT23028 TaxID=3393748 RepID=UPI003B58A37F
MNVTVRNRLAGVIAAGLLAVAGPAWAQIGPVQTPTLPGLPTGATDRMPLLGEVERRANEGLDRALQAPSRLTRLISRSGGRLEADPSGWPVVRGEIVAVDLSDPAREEALAAGFSILREERLDALDLTALVLAPPRRMALASAVERLRRMDPQADITFNHVHAPAGEVGEGRGGVAAAGPQDAGARLGLIDTGVEATHPALVGAAITQRGFAGPPRMGAHGLAVASLMVGRSGAFTGGAPGAALRVADIYGGDPAGGSSTALAQALAWMVEGRVPVVNVSLVGPRNALVERAVARARARGVTVVAAVGNDGPAAAPLFPASYEGVIGVTAVNARNQVLPEAGRGDQVDFAAPGADMAAAGQAGSWTAVRGSSFAAPIVAGLLARDGEAALARQAIDLGARGRDPIFGAGLVGVEARVEPRAMGARGRLAR